LQRCKIVEGAEDAICHFYSSLRRDIQDILDYKDFDTVDKLFQFAMLAEKEVQGRQQSQHRPRSTFGATPMPMTTPRTPPTPPAPTRPSSSAPAAGKPILQVPAKKPYSVAPSSGHTSSIQCHRCHGLGHMKRDCPSQQTYIATDAGYISVSDVENDDDTSDDAGDDDAIDGDAATANFQNIIMQRVLSAQPQTSEQQQRHNLF
jgi:hypothetical protein